jgi:hypothetical protein
MKEKTNGYPIVSINGMDWEMLHPQMTLDHLGFIPYFFRAENPEPARAQIHGIYISGWHPFQGFTMDPETHVLKYPGDPKMPPLAQARLRDELILFYDCAWVAIVQPDGSFETARVD